MKLHESLRKIIRQFGTNVLSEKRLLFILSDYRAFDEYPAVKQVFEAIVSTGAGKELMRLSLDDDRAGCISYAQNLKKSLSEDRHFREDLAACAVDSILFALGLTDTVTEPSDHGFDPMEHGSGAGHKGSGADKGGDAEEDKGRKKQGSGSRTGGAAGSGGEEQPGRKEAGSQRPRGGNGSSGGNGQRASGTQGRGRATVGSGAAAPRNAGAKQPSAAMKWLLAAVLLAGVFCAGRLACSPAPEGSSEAPRETLGIAEPQPSAAPAEPRPAVGARDAADHTGKYEYEQAEKYYYGRGVGQDYAKALEWYRKAADKGRADAEYSAGWMYEQGLGVSRDDSRALEWYRRAAAHGDQRARSAIERVEPQCGDSLNAGEQPGQCEYEQGEKYYYGQGVNEDDSKALDWYLKAADKGNAGAEYRLGWMYELGTGVAQNYEMALGWYRKSLAHGNQNASARIERLEKLNSSRRGGTAVMKSQGAAASNAETGKPGYKAGEYEWRQGEKYYSGRSVSKDYSEAAKWFRKSADLGNARGQAWLGVMYAAGSGVSQNIAEAVKLFRESAGQGDAFGEDLLGIVYEGGLGVSRDYHEALKWFRKAAAQGNKDAQKGIERVEKLMPSTAGINDTSGSEGAGSSGTAVNAGQAAKPAGQYEYDQGQKYVYGFGVSLNYKKALKWFRKSAELGNPSGQNWLGVMYDNGYGVRRDYAEAVKWYRKSAEQGNLYGQRDLGRMYELGHGVTRDYSEALNWYRKSAAQGTPGIQKDIERVEKLISAGQ